MGVIYSVACKTCKVTRDLDKFYTSDIYPVETREQAMNYMMKVVKDHFRSGLLISFMAKHKGHDCVFFNESSSCSEDLDPFWHANEYKEDFDFWRVS